MDQKKIGNFLKELRKEKNITQEDLAEELNVSNRTVSRWENGNNMPDISLLTQIAQMIAVGEVNIQLLVLLSLLFHFTSRLNQ